MRLRGDERVGCRLLDRFAEAGAPWQVGKEHAVTLRSLLDDRRIEPLHCTHLNFTPLWRSILFNVPDGMSFTGCGTVTVPGL